MGITSQDSRFKNGFLSSDNRNLKSQEVCLCGPVVEGLHYLGEVQDPDPHPHQSEKSDPDPHQSEQYDPDPHQSEKRDEDSQHVIFDNRLLYPSTALIR
jgi:hypothetical protein